MDMQTNYDIQRDRLAKAKADGNHRRIIEVAEEGLASFEEHGYPDQWMAWERAKDDAYTAIQMASSPW